MTQLFGGGTNNAQDTLVVVSLWQIHLLNLTQGLGRSCIAGQNHQITTLIEQPIHTLQSVMVHGIKRSVAVGRSCIVAQIQIVILRQRIHYTAHHGQSPVTRIKYPDFTLCDFLGICHVLVCSLLQKKRTAVLTAVLKYKVFANYFFNMAAITAAVISSDGLALQTTEPVELSITCA